MSADNGWLLRKNLRGEFVVQEYCASEDIYPSIDNVPISQVFDTVEEAIIWYERHSGYSEYGLTVKIQDRERFVIVIEYDAYASDDPLDAAMEQVRVRMHHSDLPNIKVVKVYAAIRDDAEKVLAVFDPIRKKE